MNFEDTQHRQTYNALVSDNSQPSNKENIVFWVLTLIFFFGFVFPLIWPAPVEKKVDKNEEYIHYDYWGINNSPCPSCNNDPDKKRDCFCRFSGGGG
jgi:hypothetical protein